METAYKDLEVCILGILQRAITETRTMVLMGQTEKAADLLDALDNIPRHLANWQESSKFEIQAQLSYFMEKYPNHLTNYVEVFETKRSLIW
ncbi:hypothetical protein [Beggiatoa leptomitoformis]|uniref:Uncharacterized protein n=1 Tax=Beggiatoa leptomitoformis TaxID=288004 RepID=A0A2N9YG38_9GAMM|nr:hypothetical protein [Beggiatoa leptomitoformis]ALG68207.1 hypothetical protein AL038_11415 [Beggiatoa leptomitoformis]AUI69488.1 hypothetical protein BLE401_12855 [Beggiatoa leptomitoformis]